MLRPTKHSHPDRTTISASLVVLARVKKQRIVDYSTLRGYIKKGIAGGDALFLPALNLLYLLGLIDYHPKTDAVEYIGPNETV
jgi:hypothetical protein